MASSSDEEEGNDTVQKPAETNDSHLRKCLLCNIQVDHIRTKP